jgi:hypothetical protein
MSERTVEEVIATIESYVRVGGVFSLGPDDRLLYTAWSGTRVLVEGGFGRFFDEGGDADALERAYRRLRLDACAATCSAARRMFPPEHSFAELEKTRAFLREHGADLERAFFSITHPLLAQIGPSLAGLRRATAQHLAALGVQVR